MLIGERRLAHRIEENNVWKYSVNILQTRQAPSSCLRRPNKIDKQTKNQTKRTMEKNSHFQSAMNISGCAFELVQRGAPLGSSKIPFVCPTAFI